MTKRTCSICGDPHYCRGWCMSHYRRWQHHGDPLAGRPRYRLDDTFFDVIDTEAKAYWLGFITADGCILNGPVGVRAEQRHQVLVDLKDSDAGHLEKLRADVSAEAPVRLRVRKWPAGDSAGIVLNSRHLTESLIRHGVTPRKSLTATPWDGPADLMRHYWRGLVDGDGMIRKSSARQSKWYLQLVGSEACVDAFRMWAAPISGSFATVRPKGTIWSWTAAGLASPQAIARVLYEGATVYLDRKYELAQQLMATPVRRRTWLVPLTPG